jgi:hypothetical protein
VEPRPRDRWGTAADADNWIPQPKILLEGTHLTRKTDIAFALAEHADVIGQRRHRWHIPLISAEWQTRSAVQPTKSSPGRNMIDFAAADEPWARESFDAYTRLLELHRDHYWVIDRFHISAIAYQRQVYHRDVDLSGVDRRLAELGVLLVLCYRAPETFARARADRLAYSENPRNYDDLDVFIREQELMVSLAADSAMESMVVDVSGDDVEHVADEIMAGIRERGLFYRAAGASHDA